MNIIQTFFGRADSWGVAVLFASAGRLDYWQGWAYAGIGALMNLATRLILRKERPHPGAQLTFTEDGCTPLGDTPEQVACKLCEFGVDVIGANCSVGPAKLLPVVQALARHAAQVDCHPRVSIQPNAGWPQRMGARLIYPATPEYFGEFAHHIICHRHDREAQSDNP